MILGLTFPSSAHGWITGTLTTSWRPAETFRFPTDFAFFVKWLRDCRTIVHSCGVIHGDLTGPNILINSEGRALLSDFGLSTIIAEFQGTSYYTSSIQGAVRWCAPELFKGHPEPALSTRSDVYSFGSVMLQTLSGNVPYHYVHMDTAIIVKATNGEHPARPLDGCLTDDHWEFMRRCWCMVPDQRPNMNEILAFVTSHYHAYSFTWIWGGWISTLILMFLLIYVLFTLIFCGCFLLHILHWHYVALAGCFLANVTLRWLLYRLRCNLWLTHTHWEFWLFY